MRMKTLGCTLLFLVLLGGVAWADVTLASGQYFPRSTYAQIDKWATITSLDSTRSIYYKVSSSDPYRRYLRIYVNGTRVLNRVVGSGYSGRVDVTGRTAFHGPVKVRFEIYSGSYRSWRLDKAVLEGVNNPKPVTLSGDVLTIRTPNGEQIKLRGNWRSDNGGYRSSGNVYLVTRYIDLKLTDAVLYVKADPLHVSGTSRAPIPDLGFFGDLGVLQTPHTTVGIARGSEIQDLADVPLRNDRYYLYFQYSSSAGFEFEFEEGVKISGPSIEGEDYTLILDPQDPMLYFEGNIPKVSDLLSKAGVEDLGIGLSAHGYLDYESSLGMYDGSGGHPDGTSYAFSGNLFLKGSVQLGKYPLTISGHIIADFDADNDGRFCLVNDDLNDVKIGANGILSVGYKKAGFDISVAIGEGSAVFDGRGGRNGKGVVMFTGTQLESPIVNFLDKYGYGDYSRNGEFKRAYGYYHLDNGEIYLTYINDYRVNGFTLASCRTTLKNDGIHLKGEAKLADSYIWVQGKLGTDKNFSLTSDANITIPLAGGSLKGSATLKKSGNYVSLKGNGSIKFAGSTFSANFSANTSGYISFNSSLNVGPYGLYVAGQKLGEVKGKVSVKVSNNEVKGSFSGTAYVWGIGSYTISSSVSSTGVITVRLPVSVPYVVWSGWWPETRWTNTFSVDVL